MKLGIVAGLVLLVAGYIAYAGYRDKAARNQLYGAVLDEYGRKLHPGMTREEVQQFLNQGHTQFSSGLLPNGGNARSDKISIGIEPTGRYGGKEQVYIALDFDPADKSQANQPLSAPARGSDILKDIRIYRSKW